MQCLSTATRGLRMYWGCLLLGRKFQKEYRNPTFTSVGIEGPSKYYYKLSYSMIAVLAT